MVFSNTKDLTLTTQNNFPTAEDLILSREDTLPSLETELQDNTTESKILDQEFVDVPNSTGIRSKIKVCRQIATISLTR